MQLFLEFNCNEMADFESLFLVHLQALDEFATKLIQNNHYAKEDVATRRDAVSTSGSFLNFL